MAMKRRMLGYDQVVQLGDELRKHCIPVDGYAVYEEGWDDHKLVQLMGGEQKCSVSSVAHLRQKLIGRLRDHSTGKPNVDELLDRIARLEAWAARRKFDAFRPEAGPLFNGHKP